MPSCWSTPTSAPASCGGRTAEDAFLDGRSEHLIDGTDLSERFTVPEQPRHRPPLSSSSTPSSASAPWRCAVRRHDLDLLSLVTGVIFVGIAFGTHPRRRQRLRPRRPVDRPGGAGGARRRGPGRDPAAEGRRRVRGARGVRGVRGVRRRPRRTAVASHAGGRVPTCRRTRRPRTPLIGRIVGAPRPRAILSGSPRGTPGRLPERPMGADGKFVGDAFEGSNPSPATRDDDPRPVRPVGGRPRSGSSGGCPFGHELSGFP